MKTKLFIFACLAFGSLATLPAATPTLTATPTATPSLTGEWHSPTLTVTQTAGWLSPTRTQTPAGYPTQFPTQTSVGTATPTPTVSPTGTPFISTGPLIDDFESDLSTIHSWNAGMAVTSLVQGCPFGSTPTARRFQGALSAGQSTSLSLSFPWPRDFGSWPGLARTFAFRAYSATPLTVTVRLYTYDGDNASADLYLDGSGWQNLNVATPDHASPGALPQFQLSPGLDWVDLIRVCQGISFWVYDAPFDLTFDDIAWDYYEPISPTRLAAVFGVDLATVLAAQAYGLSDHGLWTLLVLARRCGCSPADIMDQRATRSWGQVAELHGMTWAGLLAEMEADAASGGIVPEIGDREALERTLRNGPPTLAPLPTPTPYVPPGPLALPTAGPC